MESQYGWQKIVCKALLLLIAVSGCTKNNPLEVNASDGLSFAVSDSLRTGDIVCRLGNGYFSNIFRQMSGGDERFSHVGILHYENDTCFVIHAEASELTGVGSVRMDHLTLFLEDSYDYEFYHLKEDVVAFRVDSLAYGYYERQTPFDISFDMTSDESVYCTELVAICMNRAVDSLWIVPTGNIGGKIYYSVEDILKGVR